MKIGPAKEEISKEKDVNDKNKSERNGECPSESIPLNINDDEYADSTLTFNESGRGDYKKFEVARKLDDVIKQIRKDYNEDLKSKEIEMQQHATALYFIDHLALRAGHEKNGPTVGCCSLRFEHINLQPPNTVHFDFPGKSSIQYQNTVKVDAQVYKNLEDFKKNSETEKDDVFKIYARKLNEHLSSSSHVKGLTIKVFRTYHASMLFQKELKNTPTDGSIEDKILVYNRANREVAILLNHRKAISKTYDNQMNKIDEEIRVLKYQRMEVINKILILNPKLKEKFGEPGSDLDKDWCAKHEKLMIEKNETELRKKFEKDNDKRKKEGKEALPESELNKKIEKCKNGKLNVKNQTVEKLNNQIKKIDGLIKAANIRKVKKEESNLNLRSSKEYYIDPRISIAWCKEHDVPIKKVFSKGLYNKFKWAMYVDKHWKFIF